MTHFFGTSFGVLLRFRDSEADDLDCDELRVVGRSTGVSGKELFSEIRELLRVALSINCVLGLKSKVLCLSFC